MPEEAEVYCTAYGTACEAGNRYCDRCGSLLSPHGGNRLAGIAFLLNEAQRPPLRDLLSEAQRRQLIAHYNAALAELTRQPEPVARRPAPSPSAEPPPSAPAAEPIARNVRAALPRDWSWLADQQANLFLFAGAFLVVIAALIYVGYSKQAVGGALKMSLLVAYTAVFITAGGICLRVPRVEIAGRIFLAVGAILVPLNFVAAYNIYSEENLSPEAMWLAGSITSAALYTGLAALGLGRAYSFAAGGALISAVAAAVVLPSLPFEWAAPPFLVLAVAMALAEIATPEPFRTRVGFIWMLQAHAVTAVSLAFAATAAAIVLGMKARQTSHLAGSWRHRSASRWSSM